MCGQLQVGRSLVGVFVAGRWRVSLGPINSSLTEHFRERSHALLASCAELHPGGSTVSLQAGAGNDQDGGRNL